jgi:hypothetical protein
MEVIFIVGGQSVFGLETRIERATHTLILSRSRRRV